jgi:hypothetical protein
MIYFAIALSLLFVVLLGKYLRLKSNYQFVIAVAKLNHNTTKRIIGKQQEQIMELRGRNE